MHRHNVRWLPMAALMFSTLNAAATPIETAAEAVGYRLITAAEEAEFRRQMAQLKGAERQRYRDEQWQRLRARAAEQGYLMPETPPWPSAESAPTPTDAKSAAESSPPTAADATEPVPTVSATEQNGQPQGAATADTAAMAPPPRNYGQRPPAMQPPAQPRVQPSPQPWRQPTPDTIERQRESLHARIDWALEHFADPLPGPQQQPQ